MLAFAGDPIDHERIVAAIGENCNLRQVAVREREATEYRPVDFRAKNARGKDPDFHSLDVFLSPVEDRSRETGYLLVAGACAWTSPDGLRWRTERTGPSLAAHAAGAVASGCKFTVTPKVARHPCRGRFG